MNKRVVIIGGGNMGEAMALSLLGTQTLTANRLTVIEHSASRRAHLKKHITAHVDSDYIRPLKTADIVILAVKPQDVPILLHQIEPFIQKESLVISIMAGVGIEFICNQLKHQRVVRAMPNIPAQVQLGMTVWKAALTVSVQQKKLVAEIFSSFGEHLEVQSEDSIDVGTAISGTGPAYVFDFAEMLIEAGSDLGMSKTQVTQLVQQTIVGAAELMKRSNEPPAQLRDKVTSRKGTTAAALQVLKKYRVKLAYKQAIRAAYKRSKELSHTNQTDL